jgi:hypothetical protein
MTESAIRVENLSKMCRIGAADKRCCGAVKGPPNGASLSAGIVAEVGR